MAFLKHLFLTTLIIMGCSTPINAQHDTYAPARTVSAPTQAVKTTNVSMSSDRTLKNKHLSEQEKLAMLRTSLYRKQRIYSGITFVSLVAMGILAFAPPHSLFSTVLFATIFSITGALFLVEALIYGLYRLFTYGTCARSYVKKQEDILAYYTTVHITFKNNAKAVLAQKSFESRSYQEVIALTTTFAEESCNNYEAPLKVTVQCKIMHKKKPRHNRTTDSLIISLKNPIHVFWHNAKRAPLPPYSFILQQELEEKFLVLPSCALARGFAYTALGSCALLFSFPVFGL